jgi:hypothetical protein
MQNKQRSIPPVVLAERALESLPTPKFQLGQSVKWNCVPTADFGQIIGVVFASEASICAIGFHYAIALDSTSPSFANGITSDWAFEDDLALYVSSSDREGITE